MRKAAYAKVYVGKSTVTNVQFHVNKFVNGNKVFTESERQCEQEKQHHQIWSSKDRLPKKIAKRLSLNITKIG